MKATLVTLLTGLFLVLIPSPMHGCSCDLDLRHPGASKNRQVKKHFKEAAAVFVGTAVEVEPVLGEITQPDGTKVKGAVDYRVRFLVKETYKGTLAKYVSTNTGSGWGDCSYGQMTKGHDYLVYASSVAGNSEVNFGLCGGTRRFPRGDDSQTYKTDHGAELNILRKLGKHHL